jgi:vancomycin permeability regulator SanA
MTGRRGRARPPHQNAEDTASSRAAERAPRSLPLRVLRRWRRPRTWAWAVLFSLVLVLAAPVAVLVAEQPHRFRIGEDIPAAPVALVLGAGIQPDGIPSTFLSQRLAVAAQLYHDGTVRALVMSGDNSRKNYDEVSVMADRTVALGVPREAIVTDHAGFDTYSSCYRARSVWGVTRAIVVTQPFHLARAVAVCRALGVEAVGVQTDQMDVPVTWLGWVREIPAIDKAVLDIARGREPRFPGPREHDLDQVTGSG